MNIQENDLFHSVFKASKEGILLLNSKGIILKTNPTCAHMFGFQTEEILHKNIEYFLPGVLKKMHQVSEKSNTKKAVFKNLHKAFTFSGIKKNGAPWHVKINLSPVKLGSRSFTMVFLHDITRQKEEIAKIKKANKALKEDNKRFNALINNQKGIVYRCMNSPNWEADYISDGCFEITGYHAEEFLDRTINFGQLIVPEDREYIWKSVQSAIDRKQSYSHEFRITDKSGAVKYLWEKGQAVFHRNGTVSALEGFISDITLQKKTERSLIANESKIKALLEAIPDMIFIQNIQGDYLDVYAQDTGKFEIPPEQMIGKNMKEFLPPHVFNKVDAAYKKAIRENKMQFVEFGIDGKQGKDYFEARIVPLNKESNLTIVRDITVYKKLIQDIKSLERKSKSILDALPDIFCVYDKHTTLLEVDVSNPSLLIAPKESILGKKVKDIYPADIAQRIIEKLKEVRETNKIGSIELEMECIQGPLEFDIRFIALANNNILSIARDVTEEKSNKSLLHIRNRALAAADNGIVIVDAQQSDLPIIYCNESFERLTGYPKEEVYGRNCRFLQNDDRDQDQVDYIKSAIVNGTSCKATLRNYRKDGTLFWNEITITPIHNERGKLTHFISVQNDVTDRKREEYFKDQIRTILEKIAIEESLVSTCQTITETIDTYFKDCMSSILWLDHKSHRLHNLASPNLPKTYIDSIEGSMLGTKVDSDMLTAFLKKENISTSKGSKPFWEDHKEVAQQGALKSCCHYPILSSKNEVIGYLAIYSTSEKEPQEHEIDVLMDMTYLIGVAMEQHNKSTALKEGQKQLEDYTQRLEDVIKERTREVMSTVQKLAESNLNLEEQIQITNKAKNDALVGKALSSAIAKNFPNGIIAVISNTFEVLFAEGEALEEIGLKKYMLEGMNIGDILTFSENRRSKLKENIIRTLAGEHLYFEVHYNHHYFSVNTAPLYDENRNTTSALIVYSDISEQKKTEINMQLALKKEQELNELKSRFISMASHEFRTPLSVILSSAILIDKQNAIGNRIGSKKYVNKIVRNVNNLVIILNDFLSLSKLDEGNITVNPEYFDLIYFSKSLVDELMVSFKKGQTVDLIKNEETIPVNLDVKLMRHILSNLLSNASKYSPENTEITFKLLNEQNEVFLEITDKGIGIPDEDQNKLFQRFFRAKNAINIEGTGIGLNIVKHYVELMQGSINFVSKLNKGSSFVIKLPKNIN